MASTSKADALPGGSAGTPQGRDGGSRRAGLGQIGEQLARVARERAEGEVAQDAALHLWRNATPVP